MTASTGTYPLIKGTLISTQNYTWNTADSLGRGASAVVYLGRHITKGDLVAVKAFHPNINMGYREDDRELLLLKKLSHQNIIRLLDIEKEKTTKKCVLILEYCEGASLHHMLDTPTHFYGLQESEFLRVLAHVCSGIQYLRRENVIHRDIKPGNIMRFITEDGFSIYKLTDFGAARNLDENESFMSLYGTEEYLHPAIYEQAILKLPTSQTFNAKVDLWSLGVTFYHTATGQLPFQPYGGRNNRHTMFDIISQKESGVISGVQRAENSEIEWKSELPETCPLTSGLRSIVTPLLAGLMEPNEGKMITYDTMFRIVQNIEKKVTINMFHYSRCENLLIYAEPTTTLMGLKDEIASLTDIPIEEQILLLGGQLLEKIIDPLSEVSSYPESIRDSRIYLFQRDLAETPRLKKPEIPPFPQFPPYANIDDDAKLAHTCAARGELIKRYTEQVSQNQVLLMDGLVCLRVFIESRLAETKTSQDFMQKLMEEYKQHYDSFIQLARYMKDSLLQRHSGRSFGTHSQVFEYQTDLQALDSILQDKSIEEVQSKALDRIKEIQQYREMLKRKIEEIKTFANRYTAVCQKEQCFKKVKHHLGQITATQSRFRRDRTVKQQMTDHDINIHRFERQKLQDQCVKMKSILTDHCLTRLEAIFKNGLHVCESLNKCLVRVQKIEKNINSVLNCQKSLTEKLLTQHRYVCTSQVAPALESGYGSSKRVEASNLQPSGIVRLDQASMSSDAGSQCMQTLSVGARKLTEKLDDIQEMLSTNSALLRGLDDPPMPSSGSLNQGIEEQHVG